MESESSCSLPAQHERNEQEPTPPSSSSPLPPPPRPEFQIHTSLPMISGSLTSSHPSAHPIAAAPRSHTPPPRPKSPPSISPPMTKAELYHRIEKLSPPVYNSPPPLPSDPAHNDCRMIDYRGAKIASFNIGGRELICLPQAFDLFLKHLVGGLHTVYTKLKRLEITPVVCNVEQVRILRGLGAIQPGVNRCKLLSTEEFDILYNDCTTASSRPGRPPKRSLLAGLGPTLHHESLMKLKKARLDSYEHNPYDSAHTLAERHLEKSPLLSNGYNHQPPHISPLPYIPLGHQPPLLPVTTAVSIANSLGRTFSHRSDGNGVMDLFSARWVARAAQMKDERLEERSSERHEEVAKDLRHPGLEKAQGVNGTVGHHGLNGGGLGSLLNGKSTADSDVDSDEERDTDLSEAADVTSSGNTVAEDKHHQSIAFPVTDASAISSTETLLMNIQGLLKVAADNARHQERQVSYEKAELKMELLRERELRENMERQLLEEQKMRIIFQKRLKKEKRARKKVQDDHDGEQKRRQQLEEALAQACPPEALRLLNETLSKEIDMERSARNESDRKLAGDYMQDYNARSHSCIVPSYPEGKMTHNMSHVSPVQGTMP